MDYSIHTIKQIRHDGSEPIKLQFTAPYSEIINGAWGGGDYLFLPMGYEKIESDGEGIMFQYLILLHVKTQNIITFEKIEGMN